MADKLSGVHHIIGGGFSGLMTAYFLRKRGAEVVLFESGQLGGMIQSRQTPEGLTEAAANGFLLSPLMFDVVEDLGLKYARPQKKSKARYFSGAKLKRWPLTFGQTLRAILGYLGARIVREHLPHERETLTTWGRRVFGRAFAEKIIHVAVQGIYGANGDQLSAPLIVSGFFKKKPKAAKLPKNVPRGLVSFPNGMGEFIEALENHLKKDSGFTIRSEKVSSEEVRAWSSNPAVKKIWIATSTKAAGELVGRIAPELSRILREVPRVPLVTGTFFFERTLKDPEGFGCLRDPAFETPGQAVLGVLFNDQIFEGRSTLRSETWIMGGLGAESFLKRTPEQITAFVLEKRSELFGLNAACLQSAVHFWPEALPLFGFSLDEKQRLFQQSWGKIQLVGNYVSGIGLTKIADYVHTSVDKIMD